MKHARFIQPLLRKVSLEYSWQIRCSSIYSSQITYTLLRLPWHQEQRVKAATGASPRTTTMTLRPATHANANLPKSSNQLWQKKIWWCLNFRKSPKMTTSGSLLAVRLYVIRRILTVRKKLLVILMKSVKIKKMKMEPYPEAFISKVLVKKSSRRQNTLILMKSPQGTLMNSEARARYW